MIDAHLRLWLYAAEETSYEQLELPQRRLSCWVISYVKQGRVVVESPGRRYTANAGDVMVHPPNQPFSERSSTPGVHQWLLLDLKERSGGDLLRRHPLPPIMHLTTPRLFERCFDTLVQVREDPSSLQEMRVTSRVLELLTLLLDNAENRSSDATLPEPADRFERVVQWMRNHLSEPLNRNDLARKANLHPTHFDRAFSELYGVTPKGMLRELRLRQARQLLETTDDTLTIIAERCGFHDAAYLSRTFKAHFAQTPGAYRKHVKSTKRSYLTPLSEVGPASDNTNT